MAEADESAPLPVPLPGSMPDRLPEGAPAPDFDPRAVAKALLRATRSENELALIVANANSRTGRDLETLGALAVDEQPISLDDALIAHVGRQGDKSFLLNTIGGGQ